VITLLGDALQGAQGGASSRRPELKPHIYRLRAGGPVGAVSGGHFDPDDKQVAWLRLEW